MELNDNFNRADGALGANWEDMQNAIVIDGNKVRGSTMSGAHLQVSRVTGDVGPDQFAEMDCELGTGGSYNRALGPAICITDAGGGLSSQYQMTVAPDGNVTARCKHDGADNHIGDLIGSGTASVSFPGVHRLRLQKVDDLIKAFVNGVECISVVDSTITGGKPGMVFLTYSGSSPYEFGDAFIGGDYVPDTTPPELVSATIPSAGTTLVLVFDEVVSGAEETGWSISADGGAVTASSGAGTGTNTLTLTLSRTIDFGEVITIDYEDGTGDLADAASNDLEDIADFDVTNNSTVNTPVAPVMEVESATVSMNDTNTFAILGAITAGYPLPTFTLSGPDAALFTLVSPISRPVSDGMGGYDPTDFDNQFEISFTAGNAPAGDGTYEVTVTAENSEGTATTDYTIAVTAASTSSVPELPRKYLYTKPGPGWDGTADATPGNAAQLTAALAALMDVDPDRTAPYIIQLNKATSRSGKFMLPNYPGSFKTYIRTSGYLDLPEYGDRTVPGDDSAAYATIKNVGSEVALWAEYGAHDFHFIGIEIASDESLCYALVNIGADQNTSIAPSELSEIPTDITFDRCYLHGNTLGILRRALAFDPINGTIIGCHIDKCQDTGTDSQAICVFNTPGPIRIHNNHLEGAGENILIGGGDPSIKYLVPSDIEITCNFFTKSLTWKADDPSYGGTAYIVKNLLELKQGERVLIEGNVFEKCWPQGQVGQAILFTPRNQNLTANWSIVNDVTFRKNYIYDVNRLIDIYSRDAGDIFSSYGFTSRRCMRILIEDVLGVTSQTEYGNNNGPGISLLCGPSPVEYVTIKNVTAIHKDDAASSIALGDSLKFSNNLTIQNCVLAHSLHGIFGASVASGTAALNTYNNGWDVDHNALYFPPGHPNPGDYLSLYPAGNDLLDGESDVGFVDYNGGNYSLETTSDYHNAGTDGEDYGYDKPSLDAAIATALSGIAGTDTNRGIKLTDNLAFLCDFNANLIDRIEENDGTAGGGATYTSAGGGLMYSQAGVLVRASSQYFSFPADAGTDFPGAFTNLCFYKPTTKPGDGENHIIVSRDDYTLGGTRRQESLLLNGTPSGLPEAETFDPYKLVTGDALTNGQWSMLTHTLDGDGVTGLRVADGALASTTGADTESDLVGPLFVGCRTTNDSPIDFANGTIQLLCRWQRKLSDPEVIWLWNEGAGRTFSESVWANAFYLGKRRGTFHFDTVTYTDPNTYVGEILTPAQSPIENFNPTNWDHGERWLDSAIRLNIQAATGTPKHWIGFVYHDSAINTTYSALSSPLGRDMFADWCRLCDIYGIEKDLYYCVKCRWYDTEYGGGLTKAQYTAAILTELLDGRYGNFRRIILDGWGDNFWGPEGGGWSYTDVPYKPIRALIRSLQPGAVFAVNDHLFEGDLPPGDIRIWERPVELDFNDDVEPPAGSDFYPNYDVWSTMEYNSNWFHRTGYPDLSYSIIATEIGAAYRSIKNGFAHTHNFSPDTSGRISLATVNMLKAMRPSLVTPTLQDLFEEDSPPVNLQDHGDGDWVKTYGAGTVVINPSGEAWINSNEAQYEHTGTSVTGSFGSRLKFRFENAVPANQTLQLIGHINGSYDIRAVLSISSGSVTFYIWQNNNGSLEALEGFTFDSHALEVDVNYSLDLYKMQDEGRIWGYMCEEIDGEYIPIGGRFPASTITSSGRLGYFVLSGASSSTAGLRVTGLDLIPVTTTGPNAPGIAFSSGNIQVTKHSNASYVKLYRQDDDDQWIVAGFFRPADFTANVLTFDDTEVADATAESYRAVAYDLDMNASDFSNTLGSGDSSGTTGDCVDPAFTSSLDFNVIQHILRRRKRNGS